MKIVITGGCGFVGSSLALACRAAGHEVLCFDSLMRRGSERLLERVREAGVRFVHGDVRLAEDLHRLEPADALVECSAEPSVLAGTRGEGARYVVDTNLGGAVNCFEYARRHGCGVIFLSSSRVYPHDYLGAGRYREERDRLVYEGGLAGVTPAGVSTACPLAGRRSLYGATKLASELLLQEYADAFGVPAIIDRCGVIAGPWQLGRSDQGFATFWAARHHFGLPLNYIGYGGSGKQVRDLLHIDDLCILLLKQLAALGGCRGEVFNVGGGAAGSVSLREASALCAALAGRTLAIGGEPLNRPADLPWFVTDNGETEARFDWRPTRRPAQLFADIFAWLRAHEPLARSLFVLP